MAGVEGKIEKALLFKRFHTREDIVNAVKEHDKTASFYESTDYGDKDYNLGVMLANGFIDVYFLVDRDDSMLVTELTFDWE